MKKYVVLVVKDPWGRDDGFQIHPATASVLNEKTYNTREDAEQAAKELHARVNHEDIKKQFSISEDIFHALRDFILNNAYIHVDGKSIKTGYSEDGLISIFLNMYGLKLDYNVIQFRKDEELYQRLIGSEPKITVVEIEDE